MARDWAYDRPVGELRPRPSQPPAPVRLRRVGVVAVAGLVVAGALGGVAQAFWTASGSGSGTAAAGVAQPLTFNAATSPASLLYPGGKGDVNLVVRNPNPFAVSVTGVTANGAVTTTTTACTTTGVTFTAPTSGLPFTVPARTGSTDGTATITLANAVAMDNTSVTGCQGATFAVPVTLTGTS